MFYVDVSIAPLAIRPRKKCCKNVALSDRSESKIKTNFKKLKKKKKMQLGKHPIFVQIGCFETTVEPKICTYGYFLILFQKLHLKMSKLIIFWLVLSDCKKEHHVCYNIATWSFWTKTVTYRFYSQVRIVCFWLNGYKFRVLDNTGRPTPGLWPACLKQHHLLIQWGYEICYHFIKTKLEQIRFLKLNYKLIQKIFKEFIFIKSLIFPPKMFSSALSKHKIWNFQ